MAWLEQDNVTMLQEFSCHVAWVDACRYELPYSKGWALACTSPAIKNVARLCTHSYMHDSIAGVRTGQFFSQQLHGGIPSSTRRRHHARCLAFALNQQHLLPPSGHVWP